MHLHRKLIKYKSLILLKQYMYKRTNGGNLGHTEKVKVTMTKCSHIIECIVVYHNKLISEPSVRVRLQFIKCTHFSMLLQEYCIPLYIKIYPDFGLYLKTFPIDRHCLLEKRLQVLVSK